MLAVRANDYVRGELLAGLESDCTLFGIDLGDRRIEAYLRAPLGGRVVQNIVKIAMLKARGMSDGAQTEQPIHIPP